MSTSQVRLAADFELIRGLYAKSYCREIERQPCRTGAVGFLTLANGSRHEVCLLDISEKGLGFCSDWPLQRGAPMVLEFTAANDKVFVASAKVAHATRRGIGDWLIGCEFDSRLDQRMVNELL